MAMAMGSVIWLYIHNAGVGTTPTKDLADMTMREGGEGAAAAAAAVWMDDGWNGMGMLAL